jgi:GntP family gluconate:H+ symporter
VGEQRTPVAFAISGFVVGIPVFFDTVFYLLMPLAKAMRVKTGGNYLLYVLSIVVGASMAHSLVPPTPGPLLVASELEGVDVGDMIVGGLIVGLISVASGFLYALWANRMWEIPLRENTDATDEQQQDATLSEASSPPLFVALLPILLPVVLLAGKTFSDTFESSLPAWLSSLKPFIDFVGDKNIALVIVAVIALTMLAWQRKGTGVKNWFAGTQQALSSGGVIILITAAGGAFGHVLRQCGVAEAIQDRFPSTQDGMVLLVMAFVVTAVVRFAQGSATVAMITGVSIVAPIASSLTLGYHPVYLALAIGCGSKPFPWMNDSGFWIVGRMSGMTESETLKTHSVALTIMGVVGFLVTLAGAKWLPLVSG